MKEPLNEAFTESVRAACGARNYPEEFAAAYEPFECFAHNGSCETLLVKHRETGLFYVAKCYGKAGDPASPGPGFPGPAATSEARILKTLSHPGLPKFVGEYENEEFLCVVREYVEGTPLHLYVARHKPSQEKAVQMAVSLCGILSYLHGRTPPVIHRDIKPQNLIVDHQGEPWLIDFGISRVFDPGKAGDTVSSGTVHFSAPEQYGYAQTDGRADLFSLAILLGWLLTGECKREMFLPQISHRPLRRIVEKCTAFAPRDRYPTAARVRADLLALDGRRARRALGWSCAALACLLCLLGGFGLGRYAERTGMLVPAGTVSFREPLVEKAMCLTLGLGDGEPVLEKDLLSITELFIYGDQAAGDGAGYGALAEGAATKEAPVRNGGMSSLADMALFPNLSNLQVAWENIPDLTPLSGLTALQTLDLRHNPVVEVSPLAALSRLEEVCLFGTRISDLSTLAGCPLLWRIDVGGSFVTSLSSFEGIPALKDLNLFKAPLRSLRGVEKLVSLERLGLSEVVDGDLSPLLGHPTLKEVELAESLRQTAQEQLGQASFQIVYRTKKDEDAN